MLERTYTAMNRPLKAMSCRESLNLLGEYLGNPEQNVGRNTDDRAILMRSRMEMRNVLLETGGKVVLVIKLAKLCSCSGVLQKVKLVRDKIGFN